MTTAAAASIGKRRGKCSLPVVNCFDVPELMPGAGSSATPAQREEFEQRCRDLYAEVTEQQSLCKFEGAADHVTVKDLEDMFPVLDPALIHLLAADAGSPLQAMETLLALATASGVDTAQEVLPPVDLGLNDSDAFPCLVDAEGWQLPSEQLFARNPEADLGSAWCDRAKKVAGMPTPTVSGPKAALAVSRKAYCQKQEAEAIQDSISDGLPAENEHEFRIRHGRQRMDNRAKFQSVRRNSPPQASSALVPPCHASTPDEEQLSVNTDTDTTEEDSAGTQMAM